MLKRANPEELQAVREGMEIFRDSGCRLLLPSPAGRDVLLTRLSGHWLIAPNDESPNLLGLQFSPENYKAGSPYPRITKQPYAHCRAEIIVHVDRDTYMLYTNPQERESPDSMMRARLAAGELYGIPSKWLIEIGAAVESI